MAELEPATYKRITGGTNLSEREKLFHRTKREQKSQPGITRYDILVRCLGFFLAMAMPIYGIAPFGLSFLAQERKFSFKALLTLAAVSAGSAAACSRIGTAKYIGAGIIYICVLFVLEKGIQFTDLTAGIAAGCSVFLTGLMVMYWQGASVSALLLLLCEVIAVVAGALVMEKSRRLLIERSFSAEKLGSDEKLSLGAVTAMLIMSLKEVYIGSSFSVMNVAASVGVLTIAAGCGVGYSTAAGVLIGLICGAGSDFFMPVLGAFSFCGFLSGIFSKFGKGGVIAGIIVANAMLIVYTNGALEPMLSLYEILASAVIFIFVPQRAVAKVRETLCLKEKDKESIQKVKDGIRSKLHFAAHSFEAMAKTLDKLSDRENEADLTDIATLFDAAADKICRNCRKSAVCWGKDFNSTYQSMFKLLELMEQKGFAEEGDLPDYFRGKCLNTAKLLGELNRQFDIYQVRQIWKGKLTESRELVGEQLTGVSRIIDDLAEEIDDGIHADTVSANDIRARLEGKGIKVRDINVFQDKNGKYRVELTVKRCYLKNGGDGAIKSIMKSALGCDIRIHETVIEDNRLVRLDIFEEEKYTVETGHACAGASDKSGDNYRFSRLSCGKYVITLSDGMGTGQRAARESEAIIELLDSFIQAGFNSSVAVKLINSIMVMKSENEAFVTIDMCIIDLYTGEAEFIKTGAEPSFIMQKNGIETVRAASLPVGVLAGIEAEIVSRSVSDGDTIVMVTDGVETRSGGSKWIRSFIEQKKSCSSQALASSILDRAIEENGGSVNDDMTVISVRLKPKAA